MMPLEGKYNYSEKLRSGRFTDLYRALRIQDGSPVFVKVLNRGPWFETQKKRFERDFKIGHSLDLPCILQPESFEKHKEYVSLILEDFGGVPLDSLITHGRLDLKESVEIGLKAAEALGIIHSRTVIHQDIRPTNLFYNSQTAQLKVTGFGIAATVTREASANPINQISRRSLAYMSPEQTGRMNRSIDYRTDFYSLGVTLYQCLTGQLPFRAADELEWVHCHLAKEPVAPVDINPAIPAVVSKIIMKLMSKSPEERYQSAFGLGYDLKECCDLLEKEQSIPDFELGKQDRPEALRIPEKLYGRGKQIEKLLQAYDRTGRGNSELMLVAGYSGIGKSALIYELPKHLAMKPGYFITGKCDQYKRHIPYSSLITAISQLIRMILTEPKETIHAWRRDLMKMLTPNAQILIDVIPDLKRIIGSQPPVSDLPASEAQNRFDMVFLRFFHLFWKKERHLVMFIDDLQWIDTSSLRLLNLLIADEDSSYFLLLGAYRDNEVDATHPLMKTLATIRSSCAVVDTLHLTPLSIQDVVRLCSDALNCRKPEAEPLARLVFDKTEGNPFFLRQFLQHLAGRGALSFDFVSGRWLWDTKEIRNMTSTDNVVDLMIRRIQALPTLTCEVLKLAACVGIRFSLNTLALISGNTPNHVDELLKAALKREIILPIKTGSSVPELEQSMAPLDIEYRFLHDRVQEAAYSLIPETKRKKVHLTIGRALVGERNEDEKGGELFDSVNHLNIGADLIVDQKERDELALLNLNAAYKAKAATAFFDTRRFLRQAIELLAPDSWQNAYLLTLTLHTQAVEAEYLTTEFEAARKLSDVVVKQARTILDQVAVHVTRVEYLITQNRMVEALDTALPVLEMLGYPVLEETVELNHAHLFYEVEDLNDLPMMTDPMQLAAVQLLSIITGAAYQGKPELMVPITVRIVDLCLENGLSPFAAYAYGLYGWLLIGFYNDIEKGYRVGEMALRILDHFGVPEYACRTHFIFDTFIRHWKEPHRQSMQRYSSTVQIGLDTGDFVYVAYMRIWSSGYLMLTGRGLEYVQEQQQQFEGLMTKLKQENGLYPTRIWRQLALNLMGSSDNKSSFYGESFSPEDMSVVKETNVPLTLFFAFFARLIQAYVYGDFKTAMIQAEKLKPYAHVAPCSMLLGGYVTFDALACLAVYPSMDPEKQQKTKVHVEMQLGRLQEWKKHASMNFSSKVALVEAERARVTGQLSEAVRLFDQACDMAKKDGFPLEQALAAERAFDLQIEEGHERFAGIYIQEAYEAYKLWEAFGKAEDLKKNHPGIIGPPMEINREIVINEGPHSLTGTLDVMTLIKASQALSSEIEYDALLAKLLQLAIENAGAGRGVLIENKNGELSIAAEAAGENGEVRILPSLPLDNDALLPAAVVRFVVRTQKPLVIGDAMEDATFSQNPYVVIKKSRSILCMPIYRGKDVTAILYLENDLARNVFTRDCLTVLTMLLSQAAISLENAELFKRKARTEKSMRRLRNYLTNIIDSMPSALVGVDAKGRVTQWNKTVEETTGIDADTARGKILSDLMPWTASEMGKISESIRTKKIRKDQKRIRMTADGPCYEDVTIYPLVGNGEDGAVIRIDDITQNVRMEEVLIQNEKMLSIGGLAAGMAHEINNPLAGIIQTAHVLSNRLNNQSMPSNLKAAKVAGTSMESIQHFMELRDIPGMIKAITDSGLRIAAIVENMLSFARKSDASFSTYDPETLMDKVLELAASDYNLKKHYDFKSIVVVKQYEDDLPMVACEGSKIQQVLLNVLNNGAHAMFEKMAQKKDYEPEFVLRIANEPDPNMIRIEIKDNGTGMENTTLKRIFEPFFTTKPVGVGTGLGLSVSYFIVTENHGGTIKVDSEPGKGTNFIIRLPLDGRK